MGDDVGRVHDPVRLARVEPLHGPAEGHVPRPRLAKGEYPAHLHLILF